MDMVSRPYPGEDRHNMAPTEPVVVLRPTALGTLETATMRWWLTPYWSKELSTRYSMFNAKAATIETSASFKEPFARAAAQCRLPVLRVVERRRTQAAVLHPAARRRRHAVGGHLTAGATATRW
jgi:putative SOS response-associated peptidase YedK